MGSWPARHIGEHGAERVRAAVAAWDAKRADGEHVGAGLLVHMIREGATLPPVKKSVAPPPYTPPPMPPNGGKPPEGVDLDAIRRAAREEAEASSKSSHLKEGTP